MKLEKHQESEDKDEKFKNLLIEKELESAELKHQLKEIQLREEENEEILSKQRK